MTDKGGNQVVGSSPILTGRVYSYDRGKPPAVLVYPNPARRGTEEIAFEVSEGLFSSLRIYSLSGELVRNLTGDEANSGKITWDIKNKAGKLAKSGVYFYIVEFGDRKFSGKIAIVR